MNDVNDDRRMIRDFAATACVLFALLTIGLVTGVDTIHSENQDRPRPIIEKLAMPLIEQRIEDATTHKAKCRLDKHLWAEIVPGVKYEGMVACTANNVPFHTHIHVTRYAGSDEHMYWEIGNIRRTDASKESQ